MNYWLFKAEPDVYGIEHLAAEKNQTGRWDGIRNYQARNFIRDQIAVGDEVLIYHSGIKTPCVVGLAKIVKAAYPDPTQFNPESPYFDPKSSPENPRWFSVDIQLIEIFKCSLTLSEIKKHPELQEMVLVKQGRLSTQPVTLHEFEIIRSITHA
ncbi:MAG: EVE domain-containing protein [Cellvibrio sp.]